MLDWLDLRDDGLIDQYIGSVSAWKADAIVDQGNSTCC
jgi:hypothetical protein